MIQSLNPLAEYFPQVREGIAGAARRCKWSEFENQIARHLTDTSLPPHVILPIASAAAVGGEPKRAVSAAVACAYLIVSMRWFDDAQDRDRAEGLWSELGSARAINMATTALTVAWQSLAADDNLPGEALREFGKRCVALARGQDLDLAGGIPRTLGDYWRIMRGKTGAALALGCEIGALIAHPNNRADATTCGRFGEHMGVLLQIMDDLDGTFHPDGIGDLRASKVTLPVLYGLAIEHGAREELAEIVQCGFLSPCAERVVAILESLDTREFLVWCAFEERRQALGLLDKLPAADGRMVSEGRDALRAFADSLMVDWEDLVPAPGSGPKRPEVSSTNGK